MAITDAFRVKKHNSLLTRMEVKRNKLRIYYTRGEYIQRQYSHGMYCRWNTLNTMHFSLIFLKKLLHLTFIYCMSESINHVPLAFQLDQNFFICPKTQFKTDNNISGCHS